MKNKNLNKNILDLTVGTIIASPLLSMPTDTTPTGRLLEGSKTMVGLSLFKKSTKL